MFQITFDATPEWSKLEFEIDLKEVSSQRQVASLTKERKEVLCILSTYVQTSQNISESQ